MRSNHVLVLQLAFLASACGDNIRPELVVATTVPKTTFAAGERIGARCAVLDYLGEPALDLAGEPLTDSVELVIDYRHPDSFSTDDENQVVAARVGTATVRCSAPSLGITDDVGQDIAIIAGPPVRVITQLANETTSAGVPVGVSCLAFDAFNNPVLVFDQSIAMTPSGSGSITTADTVSATAAGQYEVTCVVMGAADVQEDFLLVIAALPASLIGSLVPERTLYAVDEQVTLVAEAHDQFGNRVDEVSLGYGSTPAVPSPAEARFRFDVSRVGDACGDRQRDRVRLSTKINFSLHPKIISFTISGFT